MTESATERRGPRSIRSILLRLRAMLVLVPLLVALVIAGAYGARMLWADVPERQAAPAVVVCWDGTEAVLADCAQPDGADGLHWVFPSFRPRAGRCQEVVYPEQGQPHPTAYACVQPFRGTDVTVTYSKRADLDGGLRFLETRYPGLQTKRQAAGSRVLYRDLGQRPNGSYELTVAYTEYPYAVRVNAATIALRDKALDTLVTFRPADNILVRERPVAS